MLLFSASCQPQPSAYLRLKIPGKKALCFPSILRGHLGSCCLRPQFTSSKPMIPVSLQHQHQWRRQRLLCIRFPSSISSAWQVRLLPHSLREKAEGCHILSLHCPQEAAAASITRLLHPVPMCNANMNKMVPVSPTLSPQTLM